jgi:ribonucleoside-diphosphate reductase alpha chain
MEKYQKPLGLEAKIKNWEEPEFSDVALQVFEKRYLMKDDYGNSIETPKEMLYRVAHVISQIDKKYGDFDCEESEKKFYDLMIKKKFFPNSPTLKGAGLGINLSACYKIPIEDSREGIFIDGLYGAIEVQAYGGGTGFNFSKLRPKGSLISTTKGKSSGPVSFMKIFGYSIGPVIRQGGTRNGANMGILDYNHPDILEFIDCKLNGELSEFNISVGVTEEFMKMAKNGEEYYLEHPKWSEKKKVNAKEILDKIIYNAWTNGDPGIIFLDRLERDNPTPALGRIDGTNPCGEQPLLDFEACNLGSINLAKFVYKEGEVPKINYKELKETIYDGVHFLDNVIDANKYPLEKPEKNKNELREILLKSYKDESQIEQIVKEWAQSPIEKIVKENRKIGLGVMGFAGMLISLGIPYGSQESYKVAEEVMSFIQEESKNASVELAKKRGVFLNWEKSIYNEKSKYFQGKHMELRNATTTTIAPTGSLSIFAGCEGGIEPLFAIGYTKKSVYNKNEEAEVISLEVDSRFEEIAKERGFYSQEFVKKIIDKGGSLEGITRPENIHQEEWENLKKIFITANNLPVEKHVGMQAAFQKYTDNAVSKTINMPKMAPVEWVRNAYWYAYENKEIKGITIYRDGSKKNQVRSTGKTSKLEKDLSKEPRPNVIGKTEKQNTPHGNAFITLNVIEESINNPGGVVPYEVFTNIGKAGKDISAINEGYGRLMSLILKDSKHGGREALKRIIEQLDGIAGETQTGFRDKKVLSLPDATAKALRKIYSELNNGKAFSKKQMEFSGNFCSECGGRMKPDGGCETCINCGASKCS